MVTLIFEAIEIMILMPFTLIYSYVLSHASRKAFILQIKSGVHVRNISKEQVRNEEIILSSIPKNIATRLQKTPKAVIDSVKSASVCFIGIEGFYEECKVDQKKAFIILNQLFTTMDELLGDFQCEKIKSFGSTYLFVCGCPEPVSDHQVLITNAALVCRKDTNHLMKNRKLLILAKR